MFPPIYWLGPSKKKLMSSHIYGPYADSSQISQKMLGSLKHSLWVFTWISIRSINVCSWLKMPFTIVTISILYNVSRTIINHPPVITIFIGGVYHSQMASWWHCFTHITLVRSKQLPGSSKISFLDCADFAHIRRWSYLRLPHTTASGTVVKLRAPWAAVVPKKA